MWSAGLRPALDLLNCLALTKTKLVTRLIPYGVVL